MPELGERQASILRAIVREYVRSGEPVGSRHLVDRSKLNVSSATVRNEMARLEELGYVAQPHTSAGRIPTDRGYRFVVDEIKSPRALTDPQRRTLEAELSDGEPTVEDLLRRASDTVSRFTHHAAAILARRARPGRLRRLELFPVGQRAAMLVLIAENGRVEQRMIPLESDVDEHDVERIAERLSREVQGVDIDAAIEAIVEQARAGEARERGVLEAIAAGFASLRAADEHVVVGGVANLAGEESFERQTLHRLYEALEQQSALLELLTSTIDDQVTVRIGSEVTSEPFQSCSIVVASFGGPGERGSVSVIGPTRMDYDRVIATASAVAHLLEGPLGSSDANG